MSTPLFPRDIVNTLGHPVVETGMIVFHRTLPTLDAGYALRHAVDLLADAPGVGADLSVDGSFGKLTTITWTMRPADVDRLVRAVRDRASAIVAEATACLSDDEEAAS